MTLASPTRGKSPWATGAVLAVVQLLFTLNWTVYVVYLPSLLKEAGLGGATPYVILGDALVFATMDIAMGFAGDWISKQFRRLGPAITLLAVVAAILFCALPLTSKLAPQVAAPLLLGLVVLWSACSSVLRVPPLALLAKSATRSQIPSLLALQVLALGAAGAVSPYLGTLLKDVSPLLPFVLSSGTLVVTTFALAAVEPKPAEDNAGSPSATKALPKRALLLAPVGFFGALAFQLHFFVRSAPAFLEFARGDALAYLMPVFWIGFNLAVAPGAALARRASPPLVVVGGLLAGAVPMMLHPASPSLMALCAMQFVAGCGWGAVFFGGISSVLGEVPPGRESSGLGAWFTMLSAAMFVRVGAKVSGALKIGMPGLVVNVATPAAWLLAALIAAVYAVTSWVQRRNAPSMS